MIINLDMDPMGPTNNKANNIHAPINIGEHHRINNMDNIDISTAAILARSRKFSKNLNKYEILLQ